MTDYYLIHMNDINGVAPQFLPAFIIVVGGNAGNQDITDLIFARTAHNIRFPSDALDIIMPRMVMTDGDDGGIDLTQRVARLRRKGIGDQRNILATQLKTGVAKPGNFHTG